MAQEPDIKPVNIEGLNRIPVAMGEILGYLSDNSCGDPDCCSGPWYTKEMYDDGIAVLAEYGIKFEDDSHAYR